MNEGELSVKKTKYSDEFLKYGFTSIVVAGIEKLQCVICNNVLSAESMKSNKLKRHFDTKHQNLAKLNFIIVPFQIRMCIILKAKLITSGKADLMRELGTNSKPWLLLKLHIWLLSELPKLRIRTQLPRTYCCLHQRHS